MEPGRAGRLLLLGVSLTSALYGASTRPVSAAGAAAPAPLDDPYLKNGRAIYFTHCAACHGERGQGDGASAAGFATKPSNLADGRLMNPLPDEFLVNVIERGGPAEGLSPGMPAFARYLGATQIRFGGTVTIRRDDGREQTFRIVGEDEADPSRGTLSHASPLARDGSPSKRSANAPERSSFTASPARRSIARPEATCSQHPWLPQPQSRPPGTTRM